MERAEGADAAPPPRANRIGPYHVLRELSAGAGARFLDAEGPDGARVLLQVVRLKAVADEPELLARQRYERGLGAKTAALFDEPELEIRAQGGADAPDLCRYVFWAVRAGGAPLAPSADLEATARAILERMTLRHARGRAEPLLSEHSLWMTDAGRVGVAGVPVAVDRAWLAAAEEPPRVRPDEPAERDVLGDLWRLGRALDAMLARGASSSATFGAFIGKLLKLELASAEAALEALKASSAPSRPSLAALDTAVVRRAQLDAPTTRIGLEPPKHRASLSPYELASAHDLGNDPAIGAADVVTHQMRAREVPLPFPVLVAAGDVLPVDASEVKTSQQDYAVVAPTPSLLGAPGDPPLDPAAVAWAPALFPEGASPWSEVVRPRSARRPSFTGFVGELPSVSPDDLIEPSSLVRESIPPGPPVPLPLAPPKPAPPPVLASGRRMAIVSGATLLVLGLLALWGRSKPAPIEALETVLATAANDVLLDSEPRGVTVVSEEDGRVLGVTPLRFLVAPGAETAVLLTSPEREPQRLVLPDRGGIMATLAPISAPRCTVELETAGEGALEGVGFDLGAGGARSIPGAGVVRVRGEELAGARIVRCPETGLAAPVKLRFSPLPAPRSVRVLHPAGATASVEGAEVGVVPASGSVRGVFAKVTVQQKDGNVVERLVPSRSDVEVEMPTLSRPVDPPTPTIIETTAVTIERPKSSAVPRELQKHRAEAQVLLREGMELLQAGHADLAKARLQACLRADPTAAACHRGLGEAFRRSDATTQARLHYVRYLELSPDAPDASFVRSLLRQM